MCVCVVTICVTHFSIAVNEFCQCLRISIKQRGEEQWAAGLRTVREGLCVTHQCETVSYMTSLLSDSHFQATVRISSVVQAALR